MKTFAHFLTDKSGATAVEYGLLGEPHLGGDDRRSWKVFRIRLLDVLDTISTAMSGAPK